VDTDGADVLAGGGAMSGERSFIEGGATARYTGGTRKFSAGAEVYGRAYTWQGVYEAAVLEEASDIRAGTRFYIEAWFGRNHRLRVEYDVSSQLLWAAEINGIKSLRLIGEGHF
jgi:hypothetical protein